MKTRKSRYTPPPDAVYQAGKKKATATKAIRFLTLVEQDLKEIIFNAPNYLGLLQSIRDTADGLKNYRKKLDE